jgi:hypothetical protein
VAGTLLKEKLSPDMGKSVAQLLDLSLIYQPCDTNLKRIW